MFFQVFWKEWLTNSTPRKRLSVSIRNYDLYNANLVVMHNHMQVVCNLFLHLFLWTCCILCLCNIDAIHRLYQSLRREKTELPEKSEDNAAKKRKTSRCHRICCSLNCIRLQSWSVLQCNLYILSFMTPGHPSFLKFIRSGQAQGRATLYTFQHLTTKWYTFAVSKAYGCLHTD